ncbi:MAG: 2-oxoglutarate dehydrogenase complex dihydrolipoyllysine-residue succinyltransferase [Candidatus Hydrogenedentota bacterium]
MAIQLTIPPVGESISEVQIGQWFKQPGEYTEKDEVIVEIESDKATVEVSAPESGVVTQALKKSGEAAKVGDVIGYFEPGPAPEGAAKKAAQVVAAVGEDPSRVMPAARRILEQAGALASQVEATGPGGRVLKEDAEKHVQAKDRSTEPGPIAKASSTAPAEKASAADKANGFRAEEAVPMSPMRKRIAQHLVEAQQTAALLTTFNEIDISEVMRLRGEHKETYQAKHGVKLGFMSFFVKAVIEALRAVPNVNAEVRGTDIIHKNYYDIGIAVGGGKGLVVPVLRNAERMSFAEIELTIADFGERARKNKIALEELQGGTFTITNGGIYGSMMSTPIINPPQSGILGMHAIQERAVVRGGQIVARPMMYVALTYDHRVVDGREAVTFLVRVKECVEQPSRILLEV